jgi:hypothetical protein
MVFSPTDPASAHSLWMQLRNTKGKIAPRWRSDWTPLWVSVLLFSVLLICYAIMPSDDGVNHAKQASQKEIVFQQRSMRSALQP